MGLIIPKALVDCDRGGGDDWAINNRIITTKQWSQNAGLEGRIGLRNRIVINCH